MGHAPFLPGGDIGVFRKILSGRRGYQRVQTQPREPSASPRGDGQIKLLDGPVDLEVVGESFYQENLWKLAGGRRNPEERVRVPVCAVLVPETDNPHDANAVAVRIDGRKVGHLSREDARQYQPGLLALQREHGMPVALPGVIAGGGMRADGPGMLGVFLRHDPADFGVQSPSEPQHAFHMRTGLSAAFASDETNGTHHLSRIHDLPEDGPGAISMLTKLLAEETDPLGRHFMFAQLEALLYRSREASPSALDEYDQVCGRHDAEMDGIRQAFMTEWGAVPVLEIYRQMAVRMQKASDFEQALWWARRGIAVYGEDAGRPEAVDDLRRRVAVYAARLAPAAQRSQAHLSPEKPQTETLTCNECGRDFQRVRVRGRKPTRCPKCAGERIY